MMLLMGGGLHQDASPTVRGQAGQLPPCLPPQQRTVLLLVCERDPPPKPRASQLGAEGQRSEPTGKQHVSWGLSFFHFPTKLPIKSRWRPQEVKRTPRLFGGWILLHRGGDIFLRE